MKLKSKQTGEIMEFDAVLVVKDVKGNEVAHLEYDSIQKLTDQWEDYEEPKKYWYVYGEGVLSAEDNNDFGANTLKAIGNYFETKEEAEKAVEKLKAWKRLKDKGFRFVKYDTEHCGISTIYFVYDNEIDKKDLDLLFGGEE